MDCKKIYKSVVGVILAGGKSSRMGSNKVYVKYKNKQLIEHAYLLLKRTGISTIIISGYIEGYKSIEDVQPHLGPIGGIYSVMSSLSEQTENIVFIPVDMPLLKASLLIQLLGYAHDYPAVYYESYPLPFVINCNKKTNKILLNMYSQLPKGGSMKNLLYNLKAKAIEVPNELSLSFMNINTVLDLSLLPD